MNNIYKENIVTILSPYLGKAMTEASLKVNCEKLGIVPDSISSQHVPELCDKLVKGLKVFLGEDKAIKVIDSIQKIS